MSKQSEAKARQCYVEKPLPHVCSKCEHFRSDEEVMLSYGGWIKETNLRCALGGFKVKKTATCRKWTWTSKAAKEEATEKKWDALL